MYSLDINFLKDRQIVASPAAPRPKAPVNQQMLMYAGIAVGVLLPLAVAGFWFLEQGRTPQLEAQLQALKDENAKSEQEQQKIQTIQKEVAAVNQETTDLVTVFDQLKPWSAMLQDVRDRLPEGVQLTCIAQTAPTPTASNITNCEGVQPATTASSGTPVDPSLPTTDLVVISGVTYSFDRVNDFLLTIQRSPFFKNTEARIIGAELRDHPVQWEINQPDAVSGERPKARKAVQFTIATNLSDTPASKLLRELERKGALGLVTRIENLQQKGVLP